MIRPLYELIHTSDFTGPCHLERHIQWPGGRGMLIASGIAASGATAKIYVEGIWMPPQYESGSNSGWALDGKKLSFGGINEITTTGEYLVELPPCLIQFTLDLDEGHTFSCSSIMIVPMAPG